MKFIRSEMSRIGQKPIEIKENVEVKIEDRKILLKNEKGEFEFELPRGLSVCRDGDRIIVERKNDSHKALHGLYRQLINNAYLGLIEGFSKKLIIKGVGFRAVIEEGKLVLNVGFSHVVERKIPSGLAVVVNKNVIEISGIDKQKVGQFAAEIRAIKKPEPYKGKGIMYEDERVIRKAGKAGKTGAAAGSS